MDTLKGYRTVLFNLIMILAYLVTLITGVDVTEDVVQLKDGVYQLLISLGIIWSVFSIWLRYITDTPIFRKRIDYNYFQKLSRKG